MVCFFHCFRARDERSSIDSVSQPSRVKSNRGYDSKNPLSALFLAEEKAASSVFDDREGSLDSRQIDKGLKNAAHFPKSCGKTPLTPTEIRNASEKLETPKRINHLASSHFHPRIYSNSDAMFHLDKKTDEHCEEVSEQTPSSCLTDVRNSPKISTGFSDACEESTSTTKVPLKTGNITRKTKSVQFEIDFDQSYSPNSSKNCTLRTTEKAGKSNIPATSHNPTSLKLSDEIHTPEVSDESIEQVKVQSYKTETESATSETCQKNSEENSDETGEISETDTSPRVKQSQENSNKVMAAALSTINIRDRPIIGMVAVHWNEEEKSHISPKSWDGNGIPNSTNKYKEDQKVSWHATPFEERLEKALSEEGSQGFLPPRKFGMIEEEERDTAISQMHHSTQSNTIVSF